MIERHDLAVLGDNARCCCGFSITIRGSSSAHVARISHAHVANPQASADAVRWFVGVEEPPDGELVIW